MPSGSVTFLFTDIEGSTKLSQQLFCGIHSLIKTSRREINVLEAPQAQILRETKKRTRQSASSAPLFKC
jgi:hypothetical protein